LPKTRQDVKRSFTEVEWAHVLQCLVAIPVGAEQVRLRCILELLVLSGIRLDELAKTTRAGLRLESLPGLADAWVLTVTGKRDKQRDVPLANDVVALLDAHAMSFPGTSGAFADRDALTLIPGTHPLMPLIRALGASVEQWTRDDTGQVTKAAVTRQRGVALLAAGIYAVVKRFMVRAARRRRRPGWMHNTLGRRARIGCATRLCGGRWSMGRRSRWSRSWRGTRTSRRPAFIRARGWSGRLRRSGVERRAATV